jgi:hypothetical protein
MLHSLPHTKQTVFTVMAEITTTKKKQTNVDSSVLGCDA